ncbi:MAG: TonB C-terminal domain-containing protein, partial [Chthoniobacteraceae bacterium]
SPVDEKEEKPVEKPDPAPAISTNIKGNGPDTFGLAPVGSGPGLGGLGSGRRGSKFGWYAAGVQTKIRDEMAKNRKTRTAKFNGLEVRIWVDANGRINRAELKNSTRDAAVDTALRSEVLTGLTLKEPPPPDMPMPITLRISAQRQN